MNDFKNSYRVFKVGGIHELYIQALDPAHARKLKYNI